VVITACTLDCPDTCSLLVKTGADGSISITGNPDHPFTAGFTCKKRKDFLLRLRSPHRITSPLLRKGGQWRPIAWPEALDLCAEKIQSLRADPASILHFHGEGAKGVLKQASKLFFAMLGSSRAKGSWCDAAGYIAYVKDFGSRDNHNIADLLNSQSIVNWGKDLSRSSVHTGALVRKARRQGAGVLTISPGGDGNGSFSDVLIRIRPGTDRFLAAAVIRLLFERDRVPRNILERANRWESFRDLIMSHAPDQLASACGATPAQIEELYHWYLDAPPVATLVGAGLQRYKHGGENTRFINALAVLSGNIGRPGGGSYFHLHSLRNVNLNWTRDPEQKPRRTLWMPTIGADMLASGDPPLKLLWVNGSNMVNQAPDSYGVARALESIDFKVVVDAFMTDTAERADLILPCTLMLENEDIVASYLHDFVHHVKPVFAPPGGARTDYWMLAEIGKRLNPPVLLPEPDACLRAALDSPYLDVSLEELRNVSFVRANRPEVAYPGMHFAHPDGKCCLPSALHPEPPVSSQYPLRLLSLIRGKSIHSQMLPEQQKAPPSAWVAPDNPMLKGVDLAERVFIVSPLGRLQVILQIMANLHPQVVLYRRGDWMKLGCGVNQLIAPELTDLGKGAAYYQQCVRIENG
jgi:anaerobic selenocysteine-containing dehydrogenase